MRVADQQSAELLAGTGSIHETMIALEEGGHQAAHGRRSQRPRGERMQDLTRMQI